MHSMEAFLKDLGLEKYLVSFQSMNISYLEQLKDLSYEDIDKLFTDIGMLKGHLIKCRRKIQELKECGALNGSISEPVALREGQSVQAPPSPHPRSELQYSSSPAQPAYVPPSPQAHYSVPQQAEYSQPQVAMQAGLNLHQQYQSPEPQRPVSIPMSPNFFSDLENLRNRLSEIEQIKRDLSRVVDSVLSIDVESYRKILDDISEYQTALRDLRGREAGDYMMRE